MDSKEFADTMRKIAADLREEAAEIEANKSIKCAQVLLAARGLSELKKRIQGDNDA